ncbi:hypothetical protein SAMN05216517_10950 [Janthinobacterium sp. OK676]|uniref:hypothetical protein n=1 Tax=Janthinobacterium sp. OK676 TaxID=1855295 RepID=UPI000888BDAE|nr:hypothetical protein [Janthinobacterium sp. OK676]SDN22809.1 hypothetical protein SAMN05216517_10950 [Janthinobacterium sp. OK676]
MTDYEKKNRQRLIALLSNLPSCASPEGWKNMGKIAVGGLTEIGFSKSSELLLVISNSGRGVIDCARGEKISRDDEADGEWYEPAQLVCQGIGPLDGETIPISGLNGGGLPTSTRRAERLEVVSPDWPKSTLIFCAPYKSALIEGQQAGCVSIASDYLLAYGFSWCGNSFAYATSSDVTIFTRIG